MISSLNTKLLDSYRSNLMNVSTSFYSSGTTKNDSSKIFPALDATSENSDSLLTTNTKTDSFFLTKDKSTNKDTLSKEIFPQKESADNSSSIFSTSKNNDKFSEKLNESLNLFRKFQTFSNFESIKSYTLLNNINSYKTGIIVDQYL